MVGDVVFVVRVDDGEVGEGEEDEGGDGANHADDRCTDDPVLVSTPHIPD